MPEIWQGMGKQPTMGGHSSAMLSRLMDCNLLYCSILHISWGYPTHLTHSITIFALYAPALLQFLHAASPLCPTPIISLSLSLSLSPSELQTQSTAIDDLTSTTAHKVSSWPTHPFSIIQATLCGRADLIASFLFVGISVPPKGSYLDTCMLSHTLK